MYIVYGIVPNTLYCVIVPNTLCSKPWSVIWTRAREIGDKAPQRGNREGKGESCEVWHDPTP